MELIEYYKQLLEEGEELLSIEIEELLKYNREMKQILETARKSFESHEHIDKGTIKRFKELREAINITKEHIRYIEGENNYIRIITESREFYSQERTKPTPKPKTKIIQFKKPDNDPNKSKDF